MFALVAAFAMFVAPADQPKELPEAAQKALKQFQGKWTTVRVATSDGVKTAEAGDAELLVEFKDRKLIAENQDRAVIATIDPSTSPSCLDLKALDKKGLLKEGVIYEAIYKMDGDSLTLAIYVGEGKKRPANFDDPKEQGTIVMQLKRVKD